MESESLEPELAELASRLEALAEGAMRREVVMESLLARDPAEAAARLRVVLHHRPGSSPDLEAVRRAVLDALFLGGPSGPLSYEGRAALYAEADRHGDEPLKRLLRTPAAASEMENPASALHRSVADLPLGTRRALAKGLDRGLLEKLLLDPDAVVIEHLLQNPRILEADVVRIAARRPIPATTLGVIARHPRFGTRPRVRAALARNPYTPSDVALHALPSLSQRELREVAGDAHLHPDTRAQASFEWERRRGREPS